MFTQTCKFPKYNKTMKITITNAAVDLYFVNKNKGIIISNIPASLWVKLGNGIYEGTILS